MPSKTRALALEVYSRSNREGSFANILLPKALAKSALEHRDRAFVTELVYGALRMRGAVDFAIRSYANRPLESIPPEALDAMRLGVYQILYMGVPDRAAVNETVELIKGSFHKGVASFANAVMRKISSEKERIPWPASDEDPVGHLTAVESHPEWMVRLFIEEYGAERAALVCRADNRPPRPGLRVNRLKTEPQALKDRLEALGWDVEDGAYLAEALIARGGGELAATDEFREGLFYIQDESSMLAVKAVGARPGETVFDLCSAPGGKTTFLGELMGNVGRILSVDMSAKRLNLVKEACVRMGATIADFLDEDVRRLPRSVDDKADAVLLDAPCSGLGVLASRPDARWRKSLRQIDELVDLQAVLLDAAADCVRTGGVLVYSVCSIAKAEGERQVEGFLKRRPDYESGTLNTYLPEPLHRDVVDGTIQLLQGVHKTNGMFIARMIRK
ncbi:MAG: 16S rRNA (cytosine(967)-C(5))-methyltransferase RsmB [Candidatus Aquicultorales bacterium]